jgi:hypothetical protein
MPQIFKIFKIPKIFFKTFKILKKKKKKKKREREKGLVEFNPIISPQYHTNYYNMWIS